ncbi:UDP-2,4-diacetamido-2,4,6-trideoxy-beta-L-altropyranose hydrolase [Pontiellaceae bacterium B12227]|nr:UDP-2,4-diacetamido-2,4,6-trideoxy-beta-L-altropyranose hydrolase [Pontiellaceae bacterium B12227]
MSENDSSETIEVPLFIRADANSQMGTGHVMRCIALGQMWKDAGGEVVFLTCCSNDELLNRLVSEGFRVEPISHAHPEGEDVDETVACIVRSRPEADARPIWLVADGYHFDTNYQRGVRAQGIHLLCLDDYNHLSEYDCDVLLNQNVGSEELDYTLNADAVRLLGPRYSLLRREFRDRPISDEEIPARASNILVTFGGSDLDNVTSVIIHAINALNDPALNVKVIVGAANPNRATLEELIKQSPCSIEMISSVKDMASVFEWADLVVSAGGSTCWELCYLGLPFLVVVIAENQRRIAEGLDKAGAAINLGWHETLQVESVKSALYDLSMDPVRREDQRLRGRVLVDGNGAVRIVECIRTQYEN